MSMNYPDPMELSSEALPLCPICGSPLHWECDYMASEIGYMPPETPLENDHTVSTFVCPSCERFVETLNDGGGAFHLLCIMTGSEDSADETDVEYSDFAKRLFKKEEEHEL